MKSEFCQACAKRSEPCFDCASFRTDAVPVNVKRTEYDYKSSREPKRRCKYKKCKSSVFEKSYFYCEFHYNHVKRKTSLIDKECLYQ